jgi:hypothetical protein
LCSLPMLLLWLACTQVHFFYPCHQASPRFTRLSRRTRRRSSSGSSGASSISYWIFFYAPQLVREFNHRLIILSILRFFCFFA